MEEMIPMLLEGLSPLLTIVLLFLARMLVARINKLSRPKKWFVQYVVNAVLIGVGKMMGIEEELNLWDLTTQTGAESFVAMVMTGGGWQLIKQGLRAKGRYNEENGKFTVKKVMNR